MSRHELMLRRCDACGAESKRTFVHGDWELLLCEHHYQKHGEAMKAEGWAERTTEPVLQPA